LGQGNPFTQQFEEKKTGIQIVKMDECYPFSGLAWLLNQLNTAGVLFKGDIVGSPNAKIYLYSMICDATASSFFMPC